MSAIPAEEIREIEVSEDTVRLVQITDCHIFAAATGRLQGLDTRASFEAVSAAVQAEPAPLNLLLATGDLSQDGSAESYRYLAQRFDAIGVPTFWIPGNHDSPENLGHHFSGASIFSARHILAGAWQIVLLDSTLAGRVEGRVSAAQLEFLDSALERYPERHALIALHHQAVATGSEWIDAKGLDNAAEVRRYLARRPNVRAVLWGHVHQQADHRFDGIDWMSTPSSCVQFAPGSKNFRVGSEQPGYRYLGLNSDGSLDTRVGRVSGFAQQFDDSGRGR